MKTLRSTDKKFLILLHAIWSLFGYYISLFHIRPSDTAQEMEYKLSVDKHNVTHLLVNMPKNQDAPPNSYTPSDMKSIINEYIAFVFRDEYSEIKPYASNGKLHEALYLYSVEDRGKYYTMDFVYIDFPLAFQLVRRDECKAKI